jgi:hypothetical protein
MNLHWMTPDILNGVDNLLNSNLASVRMRIGIVSENSEKMKVKFTFGNLVPANTDIVVVGKIGADCKNGREDLWLNQLINFRKSSKKIILDYTDNILANTLSPMHEFYKKIINLCDKVVVPSEKMLDLLSGYFDGQVIVIEDPIEIQLIPPKKISMPDDLTLLWFGHGTNISFLLDYLYNFEICDLKFKLIVLSNSYGLEVVAANNKNLKSKIKIYTEQWSLENMGKAATLSHACIIPAGIDSSVKMGASSNRLITALGLGLPVSADNLDSYLPFSSYYHQMRGSPLSDFVDKYAFYNERVHYAQNDIVPSFTKENILKKWEILFKDLI